MGYTTQHAKVAEHTTNLNDDTNRNAYKVAVKGEINTVEDLYRRNPHLQIDISGNTVIHVLTLYHRIDAIQKLLNIPLHTHGLTAQNGKGNTALHEAARLGYKDIAELMVNKDQNLVYIRNGLGETPIYFAAAHGQEDIFYIFIEKSQGIDDAFKRDDDSTILHAAVRAEHFELAIQVMKRYPNLALAEDKMGFTALHLLAQSPSSFRSGTIYACANIGWSTFIPLQMLAIIIYCCIPWDDEYCYKSEDRNNRSDTESQLPESLQDNHRSRSGWTKKIQKIFKLCPYVREVCVAKQKHKYAAKLVEQLIEKVSEVPNCYYYINQVGCDSRTWESAPLEQSSKVTHRESRAEGPLFTATKLGIVEFIKIILKEFPEVIESHDNSGKNVLHLAAEYRQEAVFEFLRKETLLSKMVADVDKMGNTPLHLAAKLGDHRSRTALGIIVELPWESFWFERVRAASLSIPQRHVINLKNSEGKTAETLFIESHTQMLKNAESWTQKSTNAFMLIDILICTILATAAFTIPGDFDDNGVAKLVHVKDFGLFLSYLAVAFSYMLVSLGLSYSSLMSRCQLDDYYFSLPFKYFIAGNAFYGSTIFALATAVQALIIGTNGRFTTDNSYPALPLLFAFMFLLYIDMKYPTVNYLISVIIHSVKYHFGKI